MSHLEFYVAAWVVVMGLLLAAIALGRVYDEEDF